jgi:hypothetical protein
MGAPGGEDRVVNMVKTALKVRSRLAIMYACVLVV